MPKARGALRFVAASDPPRDASGFRNAVQAFGVAVAGRSISALQSLARAVRSPAETVKRRIQNDKQQPWRA